MAQEQLDLAKELNLPVVLQADFMLKTTSRSCQTDGFKHNLKIIDHIFIICPYLKASQVPGQADAERALAQLLVSTFGENSTHPLLLSAFHGRPHCVACTH